MNHYCAEKSARSTMLLTQKGRGVFQHNTSQYRTFHRPIDEPESCHRLDQVNSLMVRNVLAPIWLKVPETARRIVPDGPGLDAYGFPHLGARRSKTAPSSTLPSGEAAMSEVKPTRILRIKTVMQRTGLSRSTLYRKIDRGEFPRQVKISERCAGWYEAQVDWMHNPMFYDAAEPAPRLFETSRIMPQAPSAHRLTLQMRPIGPTISALKGCSGLPHAY